jgi:hypothetical protein
MGPALAMAQLLPGVGWPLGLGLPLGLGQGKPGYALCFNPGGQTPETQFGPTDIGATIGNHRLSVAANPQGTLSVFKWPSPSYYDQLKYFTTDRSAPRLGLNPNEGVFSGLHLWLRGGRQATVWLRDLVIDQRYASEDSDSVVTRFRSRAYGFSLELDDVIPPGADVLMRRHVLRLDRESPVRRARLIAFANLNPVASELPYLPIQDWCGEVRGTDVASYEPASDAIVYAIAELDPHVVQERSVAVAIGASRHSDGHQVGADTYTHHPSTVGGPQSAYDDAADGTLSGNNSFGPAEVDAALSTPIDGRPVTVTFAAAATPAAATALLGRYRRHGAAREAAIKRRSYERWLARAPLPHHAPAVVRRLAKRALISLSQAIDEHGGRRGDEVAIVASMATQSPYGEDWIRDGSFINETLDTIGHRELVERHDYFYADVQHKLAGGAPPGLPLSFCGEPTPDGNWFENNYADGPDAGTWSWEVDETGLGAWTLWRHYQLHPGGRKAYLERVYPALSRAANFLIAFRNPVTGLQPPTACEDDFQPRFGQPTMHGEGPALLALRSAAAAAHALGRFDDERQFGDQAAALAWLIDGRYNVDGGAWAADYSDGGWALWPERIRSSYADLRMRAQAQAIWKDLEPSFRAPGGPRSSGGYEAKGLLGLAHLYRATRDASGLSRVKRGLGWIAKVQAGWQATGILGESWYVFHGRVISVVSQPHIWEQSLFYLTSIEAYGRQKYTPGAAERLGVGR